MDGSTTQSQLEFRRLYSAYQDAWKRLRVEVGRWQTGVSNGIDGVAVEEARNRVARAEAAYRESRNKVAEYMMARSAGRLGSDAQPRDRSDTVGGGQFRVERLAYQLWEDAGRRDGDSQADWYRAEKIVQKSQSMRAAS